MNQSCVEQFRLNRTDIPMTSIVRPALQWPPGFPCSRFQRGRGSAPARQEGLPSHLHHRLVPFK
jgi:hypothetical protein